jgi:hypothetical protein
MLPAKTTKYKCRPSGFEVTSGVYLNFYVCHHKSGCHKYMDYSQNMLFRKYKGITFILCQGGIKILVINDMRN